MIHINLLPVRDIVRRKKLKNQISAFIASFVGVILSLLFVQFWQIGVIQDLKNEEAKINQEKKQFARILEDIKKMEEEKKLLLTRVDVINKLKQSSSLTVHVLDEVATLTPVGRMWLKSISQNGSQLMLIGMALDDQTIAKYMEELEKSSYIQSVSLTSSAMEIVAERNLKAFTVSASVTMPE